MQLVHTIDEVRAQVKAWKREGLSVGLVPTMGYLHDGHKSLIERAVKENDRVVVSDFVNPTQFGENEDLGSYPRDIKRDAALCDAAGVELLFNPTPEEMYYKDNCTFVDMNRLTDVLCGKTRPIHFSGVCKRSDQAISYCNTGPCLFWTKGCTAVSSDPPDGQGSEF